MKYIPCGDTAQIVKYCTSEVVLTSVTLQALNFPTVLTHFAVVISGTLELYSNSPKPAASLRASMFLRPGGHLIMSFTQEPDIAL